MKLKKGDQIKVIAGKDRGKTGSILKVLLEANKITVEGVNLYKKRMRPKKQGEKGQTVLVPRPLPSSNAMLVCKNCKSAVRVGRRKEGNLMVRYCKKCGAST